MKKIFLALILSMSAWCAFAVPAYPEKVVFTQPNNRDITVTIYLKGDEKVHWAETVDGYSLMHADDGSLVYATCDSEGNMINAQPKSRLCSKERPSTFTSATPRCKTYSPYGNRWKTQSLVPKQ